MKELTDNRDYYDAFARTYEQERHRGYHALIDRLETDLALRYARGADVLEAGCGTGMILKEVAPHARRAVGLDLSPGMLAAARARGLDVVEGSVTALPFSDGEFDLAYSFKVLAHVEDIEGALAELARVVRPGGHVLAEFYNPWSLRWLVKRLKRPTSISGVTHDEAVFTRYDTLADIERALPPSLSVIGLRGIRVLTPLSHVYRVPLLARAFEFLEWRAADAPLLRRLGGFLVVVAQKR
ncbi:MAG TPA: class I SAM-dependent methyltransferase [Polyangia bacterium]|nr:class I SAM-dependent methyltransferase [Polyangia bacterium]